MPMIDVTHRRIRFRDRVKLARDRCDGGDDDRARCRHPAVPPEHRGVRHELAPDSLLRIDGDHACVRVQVLTECRGLDREKQLAVVAELTRIVAAAATIDR